MRMWREYLHRLSERHTHRAKDDPDESWRCCQNWQRTLSYKWNAREFAQKYGCRVPSLYWFGKRLRHLALGSFPDHYVLKPNFGFSRNNVYVVSNGIDLLRRITVSEQQLREALHPVTRGILGVPLLLEEFVRSESGAYELPTEYKCHVFGATIGAIEVIRRPDNSRARHRYYTAKWELFDDPMDTDLALDEPTDPPQCLKEMLASAARLGQAYGSYVRADFYASPAGCVFGEFSSTPARGRGPTPYANQYFDELWNRAFGALT
jgi:hypothetical protein